MFSEAEGYIREEPVQPPPLASQTGYRGQTAPRGELYFGHCFFQNC
jgi:hypothetical protein